MKIQEKLKEPKWSGKKEEEEEKEGNKKKGEEEKERKFDEG